MSPSPFRSVIFILVFLIFLAPARVRAEDATSQEAPPPASAETEAAPETAAESGAASQPESPAAVPATKAVANGKKSQEQKAPEVDFESEDTFVDLSDALKSKQYVRRAILSTVIRTTSRFNVERFYINHILGFNSIWQRRYGGAKYYSGMQGVSVGYVSEGGHAVELGLELSSLSNLFAGYRYFIRPAHFSLWPFVGAGVGTEIKSLEIIDKPSYVPPYFGMQQMGFLNLGFLIPLVDVGLKVEFRANFYGLDRLILTQGIGAIFFL